MAKKSISYQSVFGHYKTEENMVTAALLHILKEGGEDLINYILDARTQALPSSEITVLSQVKGVGSVPDAVLTANYSFKLLIESKIKKNALKNSPQAKQQYQAHLKQCHKPGDTLIYITPDQSRPAMLNGMELWYSWREIMDLLEGFRPQDNNPVLEYLIGQFHILLENLNVCDFVKDRVIIVGGNWGEQVALDYSLYICQNRRFEANAKYLAFACKNRIKYVFEIVKGPHNDVDLRYCPEAAKYLKDKEPLYKGELRQVFELKQQQQLEHPIINDTIDKNGKRCAFIRRQTYTTLEKIEQAKYTSQLR